MYTIPGAPGYDSMSGTRNTRALDSSHPRAPSNRTYESGTFNRSYETGTSSRSYEPGTSSRNTTIPSIDINNAPQRVLANYQSTSYQRPTPLPQSNPRLEPTNQTSVGTRTARSVDSSYFSNLDVSYIAPPSGHTSTSNKGGGWSESSSVDRLQKRADIRPGSEAPGTDLVETETQRLRHERETAKPEDQLQRLQGITDMQAKRGGGGGGTEGGLQVLQPRASDNNQTSTLAEEKQAREKAEQDLKESKDRIAALENQMEEYAGVMKDHTTVCFCAHTRCVCMCCFKVQVLHLHMHLCECALIVCECACIMCMMHELGSDDYPLSSSPPPPPLFLLPGNTGSHGNQQDARGGDGQASAYEWPHGAVPEEAAG